VRHERAFIPMRDDARLAARLWLPDELPAAVLLEALPYRMDDLTSSYASEYERLCSEFGFAVARVDLRGTGSSDGLAADEYPPQELEDLADAVAWLAAAEWSTGRVGMWGTSYSGFNSLQLAAERPHLVLLDDLHGRGAADRVARLAHDARDRRGDPEQVGERLPQLLVGSLAAVPAGVVHHHLPLAECAGQRDPAPDRAAADDTCSSNRHESPPPATVITACPAIDASLRETLDEYVQSGVSDHLGSGGHAAVLPIRLLPGDGCPTSRRIRSANAEKSSPAAETAARCPPKAPSAGLSAKTGLCASYDNGIKLR